MAFTRTQMVAAVAGTLSLAALTGCPAATAPGVPTGSAAPGATASPAAGGTTAPTTAPTTGATDAPTTAPTTGASGQPTPGATTSAPPASGKTVIVGGNVYDEEGATVDDALITVTSLDTSVPYSATAKSTAGNWVVNNVPEGAKIEVTASKAGWTTRRRVLSFQQQATGQRNEVNFGASGGRNSGTNIPDPTGEAYFISDYPEVMSTAPRTDATDVDNTKLTYKLTLSESLDEDNRDNFVDALRFFPADREAAGTVTANTAPVDFETREDTNISDGVSVNALSSTAGAGGANDDALQIGTFDAGGADATDFTAQYGYAIQEGSTFLGSSSRRATASWNAEGTEVTFTFDANLLADDNDEAKYQVALVSLGNTADQKIEDAEGNQLGTDFDGSLRQYEDAGFLIANAFKELDLSLNTSTAAGTVPGGGTASIAEVNWATTHDSVANFEVKQDETDPTLTGVDFTKSIDGDSRIELTFSEPMAAYNGGSNGIFDSVDVFDIEGNYRFAVGDRVGDTEDVELDINDTIPAGNIINPLAGGNLGADNTFGAEDELEETFTFENDARDTLSGGAVAVGTLGSINIEVDEDAPNTILITIVDRPNLFNNQVSELKAYVQDIADPAGNNITETQAERNTVSGSI